MTENTPTVAIPYSQEVFRKLMEYEYPEGYVEPAEEPAPETEMP